MFDADFCTFASLRSDLVCDHSVNFRLPYIPRQLTSQT
jgi:hypothetical protein